MRTTNKLCSSIILSISIILLSACGGDGIGGTGRSVNDLASAPEGSLYRGSEEALSIYFQNSMAKRNKSQPNGPAVSDGESASADSGGNGSTLSLTNIQEKGVDEADLIKTDGQYIYSVKKANVKYTNEPTILDDTSKELVPDSLHSDLIRIIEVAGSASKEVSLIKDKDENWNIAGLYHYAEKNRLVAISSANQNYYAEWFNSQYFSNQKTEVVLVDVEDATNAAVETTLNFEGSLIDSRRNGSTLYLALRHFPDYQYVDDEKLLETTSKDFLPSYSVGESKKQLIVKAENCYLEKGRYDRADIITLVAIDLNAKTPQINSQCFVGSAEAIYASQNALYLATTRWDYSKGDNVVDYSNTDVSTDIHKFAYNGLNFDYRGSGEVAGHLGYRQASKSFRFSEKDNLLRVVTFDEDQWQTIFPVMPVEGGGAAAKTPAAKSPVRLSILKEDPNKNALQMVSKLPNENHPEPIGLAGEQLYATRFIGDRAYVVTFRVTDPLYVLDLSNPEAPMIAGELKVNGYSDYLHPITENLLLGIGKDAIPDANGGDGRGAWYQGVKLSLIDVTDPSNPREADKVIIGKRGTDSTALFDHHALTALKVADKYRIALPVRLHEGGNPQNGGGNPAQIYHEYKQAGLYRYEVDVDKQQIIAVPAMIISTSGDSKASHDIYNDRSVFINDDVYYMHNGDFWIQDWNGTTTLHGPK